MPIQEILALAEALGFAALGVQLLRQINWDQIPIDQHAIIRAAFAQVGRGNIGAGLRDLLLGPLPLDQLQQIIVNVPTHTWIFFGTTIAAKYLYHRYTRNPPIGQLQPAWAPPNDFGPLALNPRVPIQHPPLAGNPIVPIEQPPQDLALGWLE